MSKETSFVKNAEELAKQKMDAINPELSSKFKFLIKFLSQFPEACSKPRSKKMQNKVGQEEHIEYLARSFHESRLPRKPTPPTTVPDEVVSIVLNISFNIQPENLERIKEEHRFSMAAENIVGDLLERSWLLTNQQLQVAQTTPILDVDFTELSRDLGHCSSGFHRGNSSAKVAPVSLRRNAQSK